MNDAALPLEAFSQAYPHQDAPPGILAHAIDLGFHATQQALRDAPWKGEWLEIQKWRDSGTCPLPPTQGDPGAPGWEECRRTKEWLGAYTQLRPSLRLGPGLPEEEAFFATRWGLLQDQRAAGERTRGGAWHGLFSSNITKAGVRLVNTYNSGDHILKTDDGRGALLRHAWYVTQVDSKPYGAAVIPNAVGEDRFGERWALLKGTSTIRVTQELEGRLWPTGGDHARQVRQWAELAFWFPAVSGAVGAMPVSGLKNIEMRDVGGDAPPSPLNRFSTPSHSYLWIEPFDRVWKGFTRIRDEFAAQ